MKKKKIEKVKAKAISVELLKLNLKNKLTDRENKMKRKETKKTREKRN